MDVTPRLKSVVWRRDGRRLQVVYDVRDHFVVEDPDGTIEGLLRLLAEGGRTVDELARALGDGGRAVTAEDVAAAVHLLDTHRLLEDGRRLGRFGEPEQERYFSNLAFFESFASLHHSREDLQQAVRDAHVLVLGTGGLNSNTLPHLCGLGVGRLTLLDRDMVEMRNFARQYLYRHRDLGRRKVALAAEWVREFDPTIKVEIVDTAVESAEQVGELVDRYAPQVLMSGVDSPREVDDWVNAGSVSRGVPFVRGGMRVTQGTVWSVDPGISACRACVSTPVDPASPDGAAAAGGDETLAAQLAAATLFGDKPRTNRGIGPVAGLLGALCAFEVLRYLTRFEPPAYAGRPLLIDFADGCATRQEAPWTRSASCPVCRTGPAGRPQSARAREEVIT